MLLRPRTQVQFLPVAAALLMQATSKNAHVFEISVRVVKINPGPYMYTGRIITSAVSAR